jgi:hemerythrin-like domain-containing protein
MSKVLEAFSSDHHQIAGLLDILERQISSLDRTGVIDLEIVGLVLGYIERYADQCHHPIEDLIYETLTERHVAIGEFVSGLHAEHTNLADLTKKLHSNIAEMLRGESSSDDALAAQVNMFIEIYRRHMKLEDTFLFPAARDNLSDQDWAGIDARAEVYARPAFAKNVQDRFVALRDYIYRLERINETERMPASN